MRWHSVVLWGILGVLVSGPIAAEVDPTPAEPLLVPLVIRAGAFAVTPPLASRAPGPPAGLDEAVGEISRGPVPRDFGTPLQSFDGLSNDDNFAAFGRRFATPDTNVAVGPSHIVHVAGRLLRVYDKAGTPVIVSTKLSSMFAPLGPGSDCGLDDDGEDPIVLYDPLADRWLVQQFRLTFPNGPSDLCVAVSQTGDPTGQYFAYDFRINGRLLDSARLGVWPGAYFVGANQLTPGTLAPAGAAALALNRTKFLAGDPTANALLFFLGEFQPDANAILPATLDGLVPPPPGTPGLFLEFNADEYGGGQQDVLRIFGFRPNFANPPASTFFRQTDLPVDPFDPRSPAGRADIEQPGAPPDQSLDSIADRLMHRLAYRNLGTPDAPINSYVLNWTVNVSGVAPTTPATYQAGMRWTELRRDPTTGDMTVQNQGTHAPDSDNRWNGSIAQDRQGNIALGYSVSSSTTFPSIRYAGRRPTDPLGQLPQGEHDVFIGTGIQTSTASRWGDYSSIAVDPADGCTFWYTNQYYAATSEDGWRTRIGAFKFQECTPAPPSTLRGRVTNAGGAPVPNAVVATAGAAHIAFTDSDGRYSITVAGGLYRLTVFGGGTCPTVAPDVVVSPGGVTVTRDIVLDCEPLFADVPNSSPFAPFVLNLYASGVTNGCGSQPAPQGALSRGPGGEPPDLLYCPGDPVTREQMAAFIVRSIGLFNPPAPPAQRFADVPPSNPFYPFIAEMARRGVTFGCAPDLYCPGAPVTREQMAAFIIRATGQFNPPAPPTPPFADVPPSNPFYPFIAEMARRGVTFGCAPNLYCPNEPVTREQMAVFLVRAFNF